MKTNDIKKGTLIQLRNGWYATMFDNMRGNTRMAQVEGHFTEIGSVYSHDIAKVLVAIGDQVEWQDVEHTPAQIKLRQTVEGMFG
jgi:hypothetical protein